LPEIPLESQALGNLKRRDDTALDRLAGFSGAFASGSKFPAGAVEVSGEPVMLAGLQLGEQLFDRPLNFGQLRDEHLSVHLS
jgi:hypothetical protein